MVYTHPHYPVTPLTPDFCLIHPSLLGIIQWHPPPHYLRSSSDTPLPPHYLESSSDPVARSVILGYLTFFLSSSSCDHSNSFRRLASFGVESFSWMAAFSSLATCQQENGHEYSWFLIKYKELISMTINLVSCQ